MWACNYDLETYTSSHSKGELHEMKKIMSLMLGLALVIGTTTAFAADDKPAEGKMKKKGGKKKDKGEKKEAPPKA
jgi:hypothetical protein